MKAPEGVETMNITQEAERLANTYSDAIHR